MTVQERGEPTLAEWLEQERRDIRGIATDLTGVLTEFRSIAAAEVDLGVAELHEQVSAGLRFVAYGAVVLLAANFAAGFLFLGVMFALATAMSLWLAALLTSFIALGVAGALGMALQAQLKRLTLGPRRLVKSVGKDLKWLKAQLRLSAS